MKKIKWILLLGLFIAVTGFAKPVSPVEAAYALIERVTPGYGDQFVLELISAQEGEDVYEISSMKTRNKAAIPKDEFAERVHLLGKMQK